MNKQSFDSFLVDGSSITAECSGPRTWSLFLTSEDGETRENIGCCMGNRDYAMIYCDKLTDAISLDRKGK